MVGLVAAVEEMTSLAIVWPHPDLRVSATSRAGAGQRLSTPAATRGIVRLMTAERSAGRTAGWTR
ncbi:MAG: hypothetical protein ACKOC2_01810 [Gemmatimonadota bacterium]